MKKTVLKAVAVFICFVMFSLPIFSVSRANDSVPAKFDSTKVLEARFLNILNRNYVYGEDFDDLEITVNNSALALLDLSEDGSYLSQDVVNGYLFDMYGIEIDDFSRFNKNFPQRDGYLYILPRGFSVYEHKFVSLTENEDGTFTTITNVTIKSHDSVESDILCKTMFVKNEDSSFGFNIVFSEFLSASANI